MTAPRTDDIIRVMTVSAACHLFLLAGSDAERVLYFVFSLWAAFAPRTEQGDT
jgi:hypothetical protein